MRKLLWVGDAAVSSGFAKCTHKTLDVLRKTWEVHVLGINYNGDPHPYPFPIYPCWPTGWSGGDFFGVNRVKILADAIKPDVIVLQNDPWNIPAYLEKIPEGIPVVAAMPVDGKNCKRADKLNPLAGAIFWTQFGLNEARKGGYTGKAAVVPLGVDLNIYGPGDRVGARKALGLPERYHEAWIVGNVNRNQPRKRLDLTIEYFAEWVRPYGVDNAYLYLHVAPTGDLGYDVVQLAHYYGLKGRLIVNQPNIGHGVDEEDLSLAYNSFNVQVSTTQGEGWGLTTMEGMACGIPQVIPDWSALGEWAKPAALLVSCPTVAVTPNHVNVVGGIPSKEEFVQSLHSLYADPEFYNNVREAGFQLVRREQFRWENIGEDFATQLNFFLGK